MVAGPKGAPIIGALALLVLLTPAGCSLGGESATPAPTAAPSPQVASAPSPSAVPATALYSLPTQGLNLHSSPGRDSPTVTTVRQAVQLDVLTTQAVGSDSWVHVRAHDKADIDGWALRDPSLETDIPVDLHTDVTLAYSILFPKGWTFKEDSPTQQSFSAPTGEGRMLIQVAETTEKLPPVPTAKGQSERQEGPVEVYGKSPVITFYKLDTGAYELAVHFLFAPGRAFQVVFDAKTADSTLFKQLLASAIIQTTT